LEIIMRLSLFLLGVFVAIICAQKPAEAQNYPWCAYYDMGGMGGATNCGFATWQQCQAAISGIGGSCGANPMYQPAARPYPPQSHYRY
jgi:hypothetical protein